MRRTHLRRGVSSVEFAFSLLVLVPLLLGVGAIGINLIRTLETAQLARDAGHMFARGVDFSKDGNKTILTTLGSNLGLTTNSTTSTAVVVLSALTYVDINACKDVGAVDASGNPSGCTNYSKWVFTQRLTIGNPSVRGSNYGSPITSGLGANNVTVDATTGKISESDYVTKSGAVATFTGINPYAKDVDGNVSGLPSGQVLYLAEAGALGFNMKPFVSNAATYSYGLF
jgi:hypothetical protein